MANNQKKIEDILDVCLDDLQSRQERPQTILQRYPDQAEELRPALDAAAWLSQRVDQFEPLPGFIPSSRRRLVDRIHQDQAKTSGQTAQRNTGFWDRFLLLFAGRKLSYAVALATAILVFLAAGAGGVALAGNSLPGEPLYGVKMASEEVQLALTLREDRDAQLYLRYAQRRLEEIEQLSSHGDYEYVNETVHRYEENVHQAAAALQASSGLDAGRAGSLAATLGQVLEKQKALMLVLARIAPEVVLKEFQESAQVAEADLINAAAILSPLFTQVPSGSPTTTQTPGPPTSAISPANPAIGPYSPTPPNGGTIPSTVVNGTPGATGVSPPEPTETVSTTPDTSIRIYPTPTPPTAIIPIETTPPSIQPTNPPEPTEPPEQVDPPESQPTKKPHPTQRPKPTQRPRPTQNPRQDPPNPPNPANPPDQPNPPNPPEIPIKTEKPEKTEKP